MKFNLKGFLSGFIITCTLISSCTYAFSAGDNNTQTIEKNQNEQTFTRFNNIEEVKDYVKTSKNINVVALDEEGTVKSEIHSDGSSIDYGYSNGLLSEIKNSNGYLRKYYYNNDDVRIDDFKDNKLIKTDTYNKKEKENESKKSLSNEYNMMSTEASANSQGLSISSVEAYYVKGVYMNNLISDSDYSYQSLTESQIQSFLVSHNSVLKDSILVIRQEYYNGPYVTSGVTESPSGLIALYAQQYNINPKLILVTLQKEKSLISTQSLSPSSDSLLWAMGVGAYGLNKQDWDYYYCGFTSQINYGTQTFRNRFDQCSSYSYPRTVSVNDGMTITANGITYKNYIQVENKATNVLYIYTPFTFDVYLWNRDGVIGGGNYLIYSIFKGYWSTWR